MTASLETKDKREKDNKIQPVTRQKTKLDRNRAGNRASLNRNILQNLTINSQPVKAKP